MIKNLIENFENHVDPNDPANNCLDVAIITSPEKRTKKKLISSKQLLVEFWNEKNYQWVFLKEIFL